MYVFIILEIIFTKDGWSCLNLYESQRHQHTTIAIIIIIVIVIITTLICWLVPSCLETWLFYTFSHQIKTNCCFFLIFFYFCWKEKKLKINFELKKLKWKFRENMKFDEFYWERILYSNIFKRSRKWWWCFESYCSCLKIIKELKSLFFIVVLNYRNR